MSSRNDEVFNGKRIEPIKAGNIPGAGKFNEVVAGVNALLTMRVKATDGQNPKVTISRGGTVIELPKAAAVTTSGGSGATRMRVKSVQGDYLVCRLFDGTNEGAANINVAKAPDLRHSLTSQTIAGVAVTYDTYAISGSGVCTRAAHATGVVNQVEMVLPVWVCGTGPDSEIWADQPVGGTGVAAAPIYMVRDNRAWCQPA